MPMLEGYKTFGVTKVILLSLLYFFSFCYSPNEMCKCVEGCGMEGAVAQLADPLPAPVCSFSSL